jgi:predicted aldo/keto reductase-like oxidoreductase
LIRRGHDAAIDVILHAYDRGIRYFDMAKSYGAHPLLREAMRKGIDRNKVTLLSKSDSREPERLAQDVEDYRKELDTDRLDVLLIHCMTEGDWPAKYRACMDVLEDAKAKGKIRAHGVSCHSLPALNAAAESDWVDVLLARINPYGLKMDGKPEEVVPVLRKAREAGKGVLGMKILGEGECADRIGQSIKWVLEQDLVDAMPIGFLAPSEIDGAMGHIAAVKKA